MYFFFSKFIQYFFFITISTLNSQIVILFFLKHIQLIIGYFDKYTEFSTNDSSLQRQRISLETILLGTTLW